MSTYELCKLLAKRGKLEPEKLDLFLLAGRITEEQYREMMAEIGHPVGNAK